MIATLVISEYLNRSRLDDADHPPIFRVEEAIAVFYCLGMYCHYLGL
jgi:hypothetical protein